MPQKNRTVGLSLKLLKLTKLSPLSLPPSPSLPSSLPAFSSLPLLLPLPPSLPPFLPPFFFLFLSLSLSPSLPPSFSLLPLSFLSLSTPALPPSHLAISFFWAPRTCIIGHYQWSHSSLMLRSGFSFLSVFLSAFRLDHCFGCIFKSFFGV